MHDDNEEEAYRPAHEQTDSRSTAREIPQPIGPARHAEDRRTARNASLAARSASSGPKWPIGPPLTRPHSYR